MKPGTPVYCKGQRGATDRRFHTMSQVMYRGEQWTVYGVPMAKAFKDETWRYDLFREDEDGNLLRAHNVEESELQPVGERAA